MRGWLRLALFRLQASIERDFVQLHRQPHQLNNISPRPPTRDASVPTPTVLENHPPFAKVHARELFRSSTWARRSAPTPTSRSSSIGRGATTVSAGNPPTGAARSARSCVPANHAQASVISRTSSSSSPTRRPNISSAIDAEEDSTPPEVSPALITRQLPFSID